MAGQNVPLHQRLVRFYKLDAATGVLVIHVEDEGPAARAGVQEGDVIIALDRQNITSVDDLHRLLTAERIGQPLPLTVLRRYERMDLLVEPSARR